MHDIPLVKWILLSEEEDIVKHPGDSASAEAIDYYRRATKATMQWVKNHTEFDFRSLGSYTRGELEDIAAAPDAL